MSISIEIIEPGIKITDCIFLSVASRADTQQILSRLHRIEETRTVITQGTELTEAATVCSLHIVVIFLLGYTAWVYIRRLGR